MSDKKQLLLLAGKLAMASKEVVNSNSMQLSVKLRKLAIALNEYDNAIIKDTLEAN